MKKIFLKTLIASIVMAITFTACNRKKDDTEAAPDLTSEQDHATNESDLNTTQDAIDAAYSANSGEYRMATLGCGTVTITSDTAGGTGPALANFPNGYRKFTIDFSGSYNCSDTITRTGQIIVYHHGHYSDYTLYDSAVFVGYSISGRSIKGYRARKADAANSSPTIKQFHVTAVDTITFSDGTTFSWTASRTRKDDSGTQKTTINGTAAGKNRKGETFASTTADVVFNWSCAARRYPVSGVFTFTNVTQAVTRSIDFGAGNCDRIATYISPKGHTYTFTMR
jgi:hypothetical protein